MLLGYVSYEALKKLLAKQRHNQPWKMFMEAPTTKLLHEIGLRVDWVCPRVGDTIAVVAIVRILRVDYKIQADWYRQLICP